MMAKKTIIYLVRHGESTHNQKAIINGHSDDPVLTEKGIKQVLATKAKLKDIRFDEVYSSTLQRAIHTAELLAARQVPDPNRIHLFRERNFGSLEGKPQSLIDEANKKREFMSFEESWAFKHAPDAESDHELSERFIPALEEVAKQNSGKTILVVSHGGIIRSAVTKITGLTYKEIPVGTFANASWVEIAYDPKKGFEVLRINGVNT